MRNKKLTEGIRDAKEGVAEDCGYAMPQSDQSEQMSVTISMPGKNISVTTDSADEIANILKLAGINVGGVSAEPEIAVAVAPGTVVSAAPDVELPAMGAQTMNQQPPMDSRLDVDGDGDHDMSDHEEEPEEETKEAVGDKSYTSKGGTVTQTATGLTHQAGSGVYGGTETDSEEEARKKADDEAAKKEVGESEELDEGTWELPLSEKQVDKFIKLMASPLELGPDSDNATNALGDLFGDDELFDALASKADHQPDFDARPLIINRLLQLAAKPQSIKADDDELANMANLLNQLKTSDAGKTYVSKIDLILKKYPQIKSPEPAAGSGVYGESEELDEETARILQLAGVTNEAQSAAQKAAFAKMIAKKNGDKSEDKADDKDDNKKPDADGDGIPDWADKDKEVKEDAPVTSNNVYGQGVYEGQQEYSRILALAGINEWANSPQGKEDDKGITLEKLPSGPGTGGGHFDYGQNRADGQGENPMTRGTKKDISVEEAFEIAMGEYRKFVSESIIVKK